LGIALWEFGISTYPSSISFFKAGKRQPVQNAIRPLHYEAPGMQIALASFIMGFISVVVVSVGPAITSIAILMFVITIFTALEQFNAYERQ